MPPRRIPGREAWTSERESRRSESKHQSSSSSKQNESEHQSSSSSSRRSARNRRDDTTSSQHQSSFFQSTSSSATSARRSVSRDRITAQSLIPSFFDQQAVDEEVEAYIMGTYRPSLPPDYINTSLNQFFEQSLRIDGLNVGSHHVPSSPFFELHSIEIFPDTERSSIVYGEVSLADGNGNTIALYKKNKDEAESLEGSGELSIDDCTTIVPLKCLTLLVRLFDKNLGSNYLANRSFNIDLSTSDDFWGLKKRNISSNHGYVTIKYRSILAAVVADLSLTLCKQLLDDTDDDCVNVYGNIRARRDPPFLDDGMFDVTLFEEYEDDPVEVEYGDNLDLSKTQFIVPTCSSLTLGLKLFDADSDDIIVKQLVKLEAFNPTITRYEVWSKDRKWLVIVWVTWSLLNNFHQVPFPNIGELSLTERSGGSSSWLVEIYSISINNAEEDAYVGGAITVRDDDGVFYIFKDDGFASDVSLWWPSRCLKAVNFRMNVKLRYRECLTAFNGYFDLSYKPEHFDTRLCSVIRGDSNFATIHYCLFTSCLQGFVSISLSSPKSKAMDINGRIIARTSNFEKNSYNDKFYNNILFEVMGEKSYYCLPQSSLPLQKSAIVGPKGGSVIITIDVEIYEAFATNEDAHLCGDMEFEVGYDKVLSFTSNIGYMINVSLQWGNV